MALLDKNGQLLKEYQYTAFGIAQNPPDFNPWRFASKHYDSETHLVYFGRRYYDPVMGRWTTPDPADYSDGPNLYTYLQNNPLIYIDGYGLDGMKMTTSKALEMGELFLGKDYNEVVHGSGRFVSKDGKRAFRIGLNDITGKHSGGPHVNCELLIPHDDKPNKMMVKDNYHTF
ncbi:MAG: hypothetical protein BGO14_00790 [Chlamydiales bacterium 38-26]|nr:RHS repeat-associated core domain-containing protein [Chlamydiales bacterium]OJV07259.1 MAG: hypothetical protein BGO14_00790 [Chlamydiales bacterium 38-26]